MKETKLSTYDDLLLFTIDWRNRTTTKQLIDSLVPIPITLWIIINDDIEEEYQLPVGAQLNLRTYRVGYNIGFAGACNIAINIAKKYNKLYILHMNNDIILSETEKFIQFITLFKNNTQYAIASPTVTHSDQKIDYAGSHPLAKFSSGLMITNNKIAEDRKRLYPAEFIHGACYIARLDALLQVKGFDEDYFAYREEHDLTFRLKKSGWGTAYLPAMKVHHLKSASSNRIPYFKRLLVTRGQLMFLRKNLSGGPAFLFAVIFIMKTLLNAAIAVLKGDTATLKAIHDAICNQLFSRRPLILNVLGEEIRLP